MEFDLEPLLVDYRDPNGDPLKPADVIYCSVNQSSATAYFRQKDHESQYGLYRISIGFDRSSGQIWRTSALYTNATFNGTCMPQGWQPLHHVEQTEVIYPLFAIFMALVIFYSAYKLMVSMWWRKK